MEAELDLLLGTVIDSLMKVRLLLDLYHRPEAIESASVIAQRVGSQEPQVRVALEQLTEAGLVERFALGTGRLVVYGTSEDEHVREIMVHLRQRHTGAEEVRGRMVRQVLRTGADNRE